jgi:hypothetical protein
MQLIFSPFALMLPYNLGHDEELGTTLVEENVKIVAFG